MSVINNDYQTNLLFKQFTGVAATQLDQQFSNEPYRAIKNIFSRDIFIEEVPDQAPVSIYNLDNSGAWVNSVGALPSVNSSNTFSQVYPDSKLEFYKNIELTAVPGSNSRVWYKLDASNNNILQDTINFKFDDINSTYLMRTKYNNGTVYVNNPINSYPLFWVLDNQSGYLQFYSTTTQLLANANIPTNPPKISFFKYVGKKGLLNLDISGQQQVVDISGLDVDVSSIQINLNNLNRMILPNGYVDISGGAPWDLCGNEVVRTHYQYTRNNTFIGYGNLPILDGSAVNHSFDPSHNNIIYELDVSGNFYISGHSQLQDVSCNNLDVSGNLTVLGHSQLQDVSCNNLDVSGNLTVLGHSQLQDVSCNNLDVSGILNMNCNNIIDVSNIYFCNNTAILGGTSGILTIRGDLDMSMNQIVTIADATDNSGVPSWGQVQAAIGGGGVWSLSGNDIYNNNSGNVGIGTSNPTSALDVSGHTQLQDTSCNNLDINGRAFLLGGTAALPSLTFKADQNTGLFQNAPDCIAVSCSGELIMSLCDNAGINVYNDISMNSNQITDIADATDNSGVPSWGQVQAAIGGGGGGVWSLSGNDIYNNNSGNVGVGITTPSVALDVGGSANISQNTVIAKSSTLSTIDEDKNLYVRNTNLVDTLKIGFETFYDKIWNLMIIANENGIYTSPITGITQTLSTINPGKSNAVPTFSSAWGPCVIPIAYLDINQNYAPTPFDPQGGQTFQTAFRPDIANTTAYFTIKFSEPYDAPNSAAIGVDWKVATFYKQFNGSMKSGLGAIPEQTITFMVGYIDSYQLSSPNGASADRRYPKPFIKIISTNIGNLKCLTGITVESNNIDPASIDGLTQNMKYYGFNIDTPKIGGICRIIVAESCPGVPADKDIQNKAWVLLEQQWNVEPWQQQSGVDNAYILKALISNHIISVRMYSNNLGDLNSSRNPPVLNEYNTDWQLVTEKQIQDTGIYSWEKFVLPMGSNAQPPVFNIPTSPPVTDIPFTLMVGGTPCPNPVTGILDGVYPIIVDGANLWEVWLNLKNWPYGITTTEEVFENNVDICGNLVISGSTFAQAVTATDITCNNLDALNSIDVGPNQKLTITENNIVSTVSANGWAPNFPGVPGTFNPGLEFEAENFYFDCGNGVTRGFVISLGDNTSNTIFRIVDNNNNYSAGGGTPPLFQVEGSGFMQTQHISPFIDLSYNIGDSFLRYNTLYIKDIEATGNIDIDGNLTVDGLTDMNNNVDISGNVDISNDLNVAGLITGEADTTFVEYRNFSADISANSGDAWHCIATTSDTNPTGGNDNARGLFIIDDDTSGIREQIIFYAGTSYARGNFVNVLAHNWYMSSGPLISNIKIDVSGSQPTPSSPAIYTGSNLYIYRKNSSSISDIHIRLYENGRNSTTGGRWVLTSTPIVDLNTIAINLDITYNPNNGRANACSSLDYSFQGDVSMNRLNLINLDVQNTITTNILDVQNTITTIILEVEDSGGNDIVKFDGPNKTTTFNFDSSTSSGSLILKDTNGSTSTFIKQQGTTVVMEGSDLQVGSVGVEKDIIAAEVTGWFNTRDYFAIASFIGSAGTSAPGVVGFSTITNNCPGGVKIIPTTGTTIYIEPPATGVYTITVTGIWSGDVWNEDSDMGQPMIILSGPAYHPSTPIQGTAYLSVQSASRYYNSGYTNYQTFNWTGRMVDTYNSSQSQYVFYVKNNAGTGGSRTYTGQIQVTRIC